MFNVSWKKLLLITNKYDDKPTLYTFKKIEQPNDANCVYKCETTYSVDEVSYFVSSI